MIEKVGSSEPIYKNGFTSLLSVSRMNSNPSGSDWPHNVQHEASTLPLILLRKLEKEKLQFA